MVSARSFVIIGTPEDRRVTLFQEALARLGLPPASVIAYADLLDNRVDLDAAIPRDAVVRIESPGKSWDVNRALALRGKETSTIRFNRHEFPSLDAPGEYVPSWAWYAGFCQCLDQLMPVEQRPDVAWMQTSADVRLMFDKYRCHHRFVKNNIPTPDQDDHMHAYTVDRSSFLKAPYGSSGTGIIAVQTAMMRNRQRYKIYTSMALQADVLVNTRRLSQFEIEGGEDDQALNDHPSFGPLLERWTTYEKQIVLRQPWIPKATVPGGAFDLRIVMIAGRMRHIVVRVSQTPITNLHLLNKRGDFDEVRRRVSDRLWSEIEQSCEQVAALFPKSLYMGIDLLISSTWNKHYVLEVNAFGDLLPNLLHEGDDTYTAEIREIVKRG